MTDRNLNQTYLSINFILKTALAKVHTLKDFSKFAYFCMYELCMELLTISAFLALVIYQLVAYFLKKHAI